MKIVARGVIMVVSIVLLGGLGVPVAHADEVFSSAVVSGDEASRSLVVRSFKDLKNALAASCVVKMPVMLGSSIGADSDRKGKVSVSCSTTVNLNGHDLFVRNVEIRKGKKFTVTDTSVGSGPAGELNARAADFGVAGVRTTGAELNVAGRARVVARGGIGGAGVGAGLWGEGGRLTVSGSGAFVMAAGGPNAAGIGGSIGKSGGTVIVSGVGAQVEAYGGDLAAGIGSGAGANKAAGAIAVTGAGAQVIAHGGPDAAGIGGGSRSAGGSVVVSGYGATVTAKSVSAAGVGGGSGRRGGTVEVYPGATLVASSITGTAIGRGSGLEESSDQGTRTIGGDLVVPEGYLEVLPGVDFTVTDTGRILGSAGSESGPARILGSGVIVNHGVVALTEVAEGVAVHHHDFIVRFEGSPPSEAPGSKTVRVMGPTFASSFRQLPAVPENMQWRTAPNVTGRVVTAETHLADFVSPNRVVVLYLVRDEVGPDTNGGATDIDNATADEDAQERGGKCQTQLRPRL